eukprot:TRINITY_DN4036_c0_g1_i2.p1 TRINITY_DN4036_c0_g1~~TRINITY_DN4036_c0_g1_i2.p1  ORF type:complete len:538 (+),score=111.95 TRINITY_DN4036_c0_g1_i2:159-1616(+)
MTAGVIFTLTFMGAVGIGFKIWKWYNRDIKPAVIEGSEPQWSLPNQKMKEIFENPELVRRGLSILDDGHHQVLTDKSRFDVEIAKILGLMAFIMYENDLLEQSDAPHRESSENHGANPRSLRRSMSLQRSLQRGQSSNGLLLKLERERYVYDERSNSSPHLTPLRSHDHVCDLIHGFARIDAVAKGWDLKFEAISALKHAEGPFVGMFYSMQRKFIVLSFKGTTPANYGEWLVDASFQKADAEEYLFGHLHAGFYFSLFPEPRTSRDDPFSEMNPYKTIVSKIRHHAKLILGKDARQRGEKVSLWVTGHSLGAALATVFYARVLKSKGDLGHYISPCDLYSFGSPRVGDKQFSRKFQSYLQTPMHNPCNHFRVVAGKDIVAMMPPSLSDTRFGEYTSKGDSWNFAHVGSERRLSRDEPPPSHLHDYRSYTKRIKMRWDDHFPRSYWDALQLSLPKEHVLVKLDEHNPVDDEKRNLLRSHQPETLQ